MPSPDKDVANNQEPYSPPDKTDNTASTTKKSDPVSQTNTESSGTTTKITIAVNTAPFNDRSKKAQEQATGYIIKTTDQYGVVGTKLTSANKYFLAAASPNDKAALTVASSLIRTEIPKTRGDYSPSHLPSNMVLPNCVGGARGRYLELLQDPNEKFISRIAANPPGFWRDDWFPPARHKSYFGNKTESEIEQEGYKKLFEDIYVKKNTYEYGGEKIYQYCGRGKASDGFKPLPGAFITWNNLGAPAYGHIGFIEAVYNYGQPDEYIITTESAYGHYSISEKMGILCLYKRAKYGLSILPYADTYYNNHVNATFLYTPLCAGATGGDSGSFRTIEIDWQAPTDEQLEAYRQIVESLKNKNRELKVGDKVEIQWNGNSKANGKGKGVNKIGGHGWVRSIKDSGMPFRYEIVDRQLFGSTIGFFDRKSLKLL